MRPAAGRASSPNQPVARSADSRACARRAGLRPLVVACGRLRLWRQPQAHQLHRQGPAREGLGGRGCQALRSFAVRGGGLTMRVGCRCDAREFHARESGPRGREYLVVVQRRLCRACVSPALSTDAHRAQSTVAHSRRECMYLGSHHYNTQNSATPPACEPLGPALVGPLPSRPRRRRARPD